MIAIGVDVVGHVNGGSTSGAWADVERLIDGTTMTLELAFTGNPRAMLDVVTRMVERDELHRLIIGSDTPVGSGVMPLAVVRTVLFLSALGSLAPETAIALATGNTARVYGYDTGRIAPGLAADLLIMDAPRGSLAPDALGAFRRGDNPGIAMVMVDGQVITTRPRNTLPPARAVTIKERRRE
jgi:enamidase